MSTHKHIDLICVAVLACTLLLTILFINGKSFGLEAIVDWDAEGSSDSVFFTLNDRDGSWNTAGATRITLAGDHAVVAGGGAYAYDGGVVIAQAGRYVLSGSLTNGSVTVSADSSAKVWLLLDGVDIRCEDSACLITEQADKVFLTLAEGTENSMSSGASYSESAAADNIGGVLFSRDDLTVNGSGSLSITGAYKHGIDANDELVITGGSISVEAPQDAIHANDGLRIENAELKLRAGDEGLNLQGEEALLYIASGDIEISSEGACIKSAGGLLVEGGSFRLRSSADGIHGADSVVITGGALTIHASDDGIHADKAVSISGGSLKIPSCYEGVEALTIDISGGEIEIYPADDGMNAYGGSSFGFGPPGMFGQNADTGEGETDAESWIHISGGSITIVNKTARDADGLDSNGDILISGGSIRISLPGSGSNNAIDYGSESGGICEISGGDVVACGAGMMAENFSDGSAQCSIFYIPGYTASAETTVTLKDAAGKVLLSYTPPCSFSSVALSCPEMKLGETYTVVIGDREEQITLDTVNTTNAGTGGFGAGQMGPGGGRGNRPDGMERPDGMGHPGGRGMMPAGEDGVMPSPPDFGGEMPDFAGMPAPPDFGGAPPEFERERQSGEQRTQPHQTGSAQSENTQHEPDTAALMAEGADTGPQPVTRETRYMIGACFLILAAGVLFAAKYKV